MHQPIRHHFNVFAQFGCDEPVLYETLTTYESPKDFLRMTQDRFGSKWRVWMTRVHAEHPHKCRQYQHHEDRVVTRLRSWEGASEIAPLVRGEVAP